MKPIDFVTVLADRPLEDVLRSAPPRLRKYMGHRTGDELLDLCANYYMGGVEIWMLCFLDETEQLPNDGIVVATLDASLIVVREQRPRVILVQGDCPSHVYCAVAEDGSSFLDALSIVVKRELQGEAFVEACARAARVPVSEAWKFYGHFTE
ncbi:hypothetical protein YTPLAS18_12490 [Nitrospira sp.]|nr:hypothetical protein YTPLAS18_12490 [Nitrospira sp.]